MDVATKGSNLTNLRKGLVASSTTQNLSLMDHLLAAEAGGNFGGSGGEMQGLHRATGPALAEAPHGTGVTKQFGQRRVGFDDDVAARDSPCWQ